MKSKFDKPLGHMVWFKIFLTVLVFLPPYTQIAYDPSHTSDVIAVVMVYPLVILSFYGLLIAYKEKSLV